MLAVCATAIITACAGSSPNGYTNVYTPAADLEKIKAEFDQNNIPSGIGIGQSADEMIAKNQSIDEAQTAIQLAIKNFIVRFKDQYAANINGESGRIWEDKAISIAMGELSGVTIYKTITQFSEKDGTYKIYSLAAMNPSAINSAMQKAADEAETEDTIKLMIRSEEMQAKLEKAEKAYQNLMDNK